MFVLYLPVLSAPYPLELWGLHHLTMTTYKQDRSVRSRTGDSLSFCGMGQLSGTFQTMDEPIAT